MKKIILFLISVGIFVPVLRAQNNVKMVTYFPVPYVAYGDLSAQNLQMGFSSDTEVKVFGNISADSVNVTNDKTLTLNANATGDATVQETKLQGKKGELPGTLSPKDGAAGTLYLNPNSTVVQSLETTGRAVMDKLSLGSHEFPACDATNHKIAWQPLMVSGKTGWFLICGAPTTGPTCTPGQKEERSCGANDSGKKTCTCKSDGSGWECEACKGNRWSGIRGVCQSSYNYSQELPGGEGKPELEECDAYCRDALLYESAAGKGEPPLCFGLYSSMYVPDGNIDFDTYELEGQPCSNLGDYAEESKHFTVSGYTENGECICTRNLYAAVCERGQILDN